MNPWLLRRHLTAITSAIFACCSLIASVHAGPDNLLGSRALFASSLEAHSSDIELTYSYEVHKLARRVLSDYYFDSDDIMNRTSFYFPLYDHALGSEEAPLEIKYLSVIESGLDPSAVSGVGATGLWQFRKTIGRHYGLNINYAVDERMDPIRSAVAASRYLTELYEEFGDWELALSAYNCGPGRVNEAIREGNSRDFQDIKYFLPRETRWFIPKFMAFNWALNVLEKERDIFLSASDVHPIGTVLVTEYYHFSELSAITGMSDAEIKDYNPSFLRNFIPKSVEGYHLTLPLQAILHFMEVAQDEAQLVYRSDVHERSLKEMQVLSALKNASRNSIPQNLLTLKLDSASERWILADDHDNEEESPTLLVSSSAVLQKRRKSFQTKAEPKSKITKVIVASLERNTIAHIELA
jgi:membrane-bound lytic murein transglycosylase D